jgi:hypothetical protein
VMWRAFAPYPGLRLRFFSDTMAILPMACDLQTAQFCHGRGTCRLFGCMYDNLKLLLTILWVEWCQYIVR